jgi:hypothetical protein
VRFEVGDRVRIVAGGSTIPSNNHTAIAKSVGKIGMIVAIDVGHWPYKVLLDGDDKGPMPLDDREMVHADNGVSLFMECV